MGDKRVAALLVAVALLSVGYRLLKSPGGPAAPPSQAVEAPPPAPGVPESVPPPAAPAIASIKAFLPAGGPGPAWSWERNPFLPSGTERAKGNGGADSAVGDGAGEGAPGEERLPELRGTVTSRDAGLAIFGDRLVPAGGKIGEWTLMEVEPYKVSLRRGKETRVLELYRQ
jgi:hypothetical protein